jgi:hypothetical protein
MAKGGRGPVDRREIENGGMTLAGNREVGGNSQQVSE